MLLLTSKGAAGVTGSGFIVLAATLSAVGHVPVAGLALILGIDRFMSEARALTNLIGNGVATVVVAKWTRRPRHRAPAPHARRRDRRGGRGAGGGARPPAGAPGRVDEPAGALGRVPAEGGRSAPRREALRACVLLLYKHPAFADNRRTLRRHVHGHAPSKPSTPKKPRPCRPPSRRSRSSSARARSCAWAKARSIEDIQVVSTGSLGLDIALGVGGLPRGRVVEIYGPESSGKTTLTLQVIAEMQKLGGTCAFIDAEHALDVAVRAEARRQPVRTC